MVTAHAEAGRATGGSEWDGASNGKNRRGPTVRRVRNHAPHQRQRLRGLGAAIKSGELPALKCQECGEEHRNTRWSGFCCRIHMQRHMNRHAILTCSVFADPAYSVEMTTLTAFDWADRVDFLTARDCDCPFGASARN